MINTGAATDIATISLRGEKWYIAPETLPIITSPNKKDALSRTISNSTPISYFRIIIVMYEQYSLLIKNVRVNVANKATEMYVVILTNTSSERRMIAINDIALIRSRITARLRVFRS